MLSRNTFLTVITVISMTSSTFAQLVPGPGSGGNQTPPNQPNPPRYDGRNDHQQPQPHQPPRHEPPRHQPQPPHYQPPRHDQPYYPPPRNEPNPPRYDGRNDDYPRYPRPGYPHNPPAPQPYPDYPNYPQPYPDYPPAPYPDYPPTPYPDYPDYGRTEVKSTYIGRSVRNERLALKDLVGLNEYYRGWEIVSVRASTRPNSSSTTIARLVVDGRIIASETNPGYDINLYPSQRITVGGYGQAINLEIVGSTIIENLEVEIRSGGSDYNPPPTQDDVLEIPMYRNVSGDDQIDLTVHLDMYRHQGLRVQEILITGRSTYGTGAIDLVVNGYNSGSTYLSQSGYSSTESIYVQRVVRIERNGYLALRTRGNMSIERVSLILTRN